MNADSFELFSNYLLKDLYAANDTLALAGIYLISKRIILSVCAASDFIKTYIISRAGSKNVIKLYGGQWAGRWWEDDVGG